MIRPDYTAESIYTILHSRDLADLCRAGGSGEFTEGKKWVRAKSLLEDARKAGQLVPVIFAPGERIHDLTHFGILKNVRISQNKVGEWSTTVSIHDLTKTRPPRPTKTQLVVSSTGRTLPASHIRPYVIVQTPKFLDKQKTKTTSPGPPVPRGGARVPTQPRSGRIAAKDRPIATRRDEFTDRQKAEIFARDRAICCFSGKSLWFLDYGGAPSSPDWVDHIDAASKGGRAELENGTCASWLYNKLKRDSGGAPYLFRKGQPTDDFFTFYEVVPDHIARHLRRFASLHYSDWYFNCAVSRVKLAAAIQTETRVDGTPFTRDPEYWCRAAFKRLLEWRQFVQRERPDDFESRGLLPPNPSADHELLIKLTALTDLKEVVRIASTLAPFSAASWRAMVDLSRVKSPLQAFDLVKRVDADRHVVPRIKEAIRHNVDVLYR